MSEKIIVPFLGESITEATVSKWLKNEGDEVKTDEPIVELETDKVNLEVPSPISGKLTEIISKNANFYWCQEEPKNMGAWFSVRDYIQWTLDNIKASNNMISYIGRSPDASPATGYLKRHMSQQQEILKKVFE